MVEELKEKIKDLENRLQLSKDIRSDLEKKIEAANQRNLAHQIISQQIQADNYSLQCEVLILKSKTTER